MSVPTPKPQRGTAYLPGRTTTCSGGTERVRLCPSRRRLRLALEGQGDDRPVAGSAEVDLADLAEEDQPLDRRREAVRAGGTFGPIAATRAGSRG